MIRKGALCFPSELLTSHRVRIAATLCEVSEDAVIVGYLRLMEWCNQNIDHDLPCMADDKMRGITGISKIADFRALFTMDNGRLRYFDEYMAPGIKERVGAARRQKAWRERQKAPPPPKRQPKTPQPDMLFDAAWACYPARSGGNPKPAALKAWTARVREGVNPQEMLDATQRYAAYCSASGRINTEFVMQGQTFFGKGERWKEAWVAPARAGRDEEVLDNIMSEVSSAYAIVV